MSQIDNAALRKEAAGYGLIPYPVIVFNKNREAVYFNPASAAESTLRLTEDFISRSLTPQSKAHVQKCCCSGKPETFTQSFGKYAPKEFLIDFRPISLGYAMTLCEKKAADFSSKLRYTADPNGERLRNSLHLMLAAGDLMLKDPNAEVVRRGHQCRKQTLRVIRICRLMDMLEEEPECVIANPSDMIHLINEEMAPFLKKQYDRVLTYKKISERHPIKCCPHHLQHIIYSAVSFLLSHTEGTIEIQQSHTPDAVLMTLMAKSRRPVTDSDPFVATATELIRRGQGDLEIEEGTDRLCVRLTLPHAETEYMIREQLAALLEHDLPINDIEFCEN